MEIINNYISQIKLGTPVNFGFYEFKPMYVSQIPIPKATSAQQAEIAAIVDCIIEAKKADASADTSELEREIDELVYRLYELTDEEIRIVEGRDVV